MPDLETHRFRSWCILVYLNFPAFVPEAQHRTANRERHLDSCTKVDRLHYLLLAFTTVHLNDTKENRWTRTRRILMSYAFEEEKCMVPEPVVSRIDTRI